MGGNILAKSLGNITASSCFVEQESDKRLEMYPFGSGIGLGKAPTPSVERHTVVLGCPCYQAIPTIHGGPTICGGKRIVYNPSGGGGHLSVRRNPSMDIMPSTKEHQPHPSFPTGTVSLKIPMRSHEIFTVQI